MLFSSSAAFFTFWKPFELFLCDSVLALLSSFITSTAAVIVTGVTFPDGAVRALFVVCLLIDVGQVHNGSRQSMI